VLNHRDKVEGSEGVGSRESHAQEIPVPTEVAPEAGLGSIQREQAPFLVVLTAEGWSVDESHTTAEFGSSTTTTGRRT
jgi:hypothetical protein